MLGSFANTMQAGSFLASWAPYAKAEELSSATQKTLEVTLPALNAAAASQFKTANAIRVFAGPKAVVLPQLQARYGSVTEIDIDGRLITRP